MSWTAEDYELHGFKRITCPKCGWKGMPECGCFDRDTCECGEAPEDCTCVECAECGETMERGEDGDREDARCPSCELGGVHPDSVTEKSTKHVARKDHGHVKAGDTYRRTVSLGHYIDGPRWMAVTKAVVKRASVPEVA